MHLLQDAEEKLRDDLEQLKKLEEARLAGERRGVRKLEGKRATFADSSEALKVEISELLGS